MGDRFEWAVAGSSDVVLIGAPGDDSVADNAGAVYAFDASMGQLPEDYFGPSPLAREIGSTVVAVGNRVLAAGTGIAYLFDASSGQVQVLQTFTGLLPAFNANQEAYASRVAAADHRGRCPTGS